MIFKISTIQLSFIVLPDDIQTIFFKKNSLLNSIVPKTKLYFKIKEVGRQTTLKYLVFTHEDGHYQLNRKYFTRLSEGKNPNLILQPCSLGFILPKITFRNSDLTLGLNILYLFYKNVLSSFRFYVNIEDKKDKICL